MLWAKSLYIVSHAVSYLYIVQHTIFTFGPVKSCNFKKKIESSWSKTVDLTHYSCVIKGQLISKANCQAVNSSKKWTNEFVFTTMRLVFVRFLEEIKDTKKTFRNYLTFKFFSKQTLSKPFYRIFPHKYGLRLYLKCSLFKSPVAIFSNS